MDKRREAEYMNKWGFKRREDYVKHVKEKIDDFEFIAGEIFNRFTRKATEWERDYLKDKKKRFVARAERPPEGKLIKDPERVVEKILQSWEDHRLWENLSDEEKSYIKEPPKYDPSCFIETMPDLVRFRILCNYLSDLYYVDNRIKEFNNKDETIELIERHDYIATPFAERRVGHRALQYVFRYCNGEDTLLFEVQVMSQLQHAWDKKDHHLIYEYDRIKQGNRIPLHLRNRMAAMSELLYVADTVFDSLYDDITEIMEKNKE